MTIGNKIQHRLRAIKIAYRHYKAIKNHISLVAWQYDYLPKLIKFNDIHQGQDCIIIGNGPSLNKMDLSMLKDYYTIGMNKIHMYDKYDLGLSYIAAVNPLVIEQSKEVYEQSKIPIFLSLENSSCISDNVKNIYKIDSKPAFGFGTSVGGPVYEGGTVTSIAIQIAYAMGFARVALIGVDHNFKQAGVANSEQVLEKEDENHFHPDYFKGQKWHLADIPANEISYNIADYYFKRFGREIYDCTVEGKLQIFEKRNFEEILKTFKKKSN